MKLTEHQLRRIIKESLNDVGYMDPDVVYDQLSKPIQGPYFRQSGETYLSRVLDQIEGDAIQKAVMSVLEALWLDSAPIGAGRDLEKELKKVRNEDDLVGVVAEWVPRYWIVNDMGRIMGRK